MSPVAMNYTDPHCQMCCGILSLQVPLDTYLLVWTKSAHTKSLLFCGQHRWQTGLSIHSSRGRGRVWHGRPLCCPPVPCIRSAGDKLRPEVEFPTLSMSNPSKGARNGLTSLSEVQRIWAWAGPAAIYDILFRATQLGATQQQQ